MGLGLFVMLVIARERCTDPVVVQEGLGVAGVLGCYEVRFFEDPESPERNILQVPDRRTNDEQSPRHNLSSIPKARGVRLEA